MNERRAVLTDGTQIVIRQLLPEDIALYPDFLSEVTAEDLRLRFFASTRRLSGEAIDRLVHYDPACAMAFIALDAQSGKLLSVARLHDEPGGESAEFAILVRSGLKLHGIGWLLMQHIITFARSKPLKAVHGRVLAENQTMLLMCAELGFHIADDPDEPGVKLATLRLTSEA